MLADGSNDYLYGPGVLPIEQISGAGTVSYFFHDGNGNTRALLTSGGGAWATFSYTPYGALASQTGILTTPLLYGQGYTDAATGLVCLVNRYYDPATAQFLSVDPLVSAMLQPYGYMSDDPVNGSDPSGQLSPWVGWVVSVVDTPATITDHVYDLAKTEFQFELNDCYSSLSQECNRLANDDLTNVINLAEDFGFSQLKPIVGATFGALQIELSPQQAYAPGYSYPSSSGQSGCGPVQQSSYGAVQFLQPAIGNLQGSSIRLQ